MQLFMQLKTLDVAITVTTLTITGKIFQASNVLEVTDESLFSGDFSSTPSQDQSLLTKKCSRIEMEIVVRKIHPK